MKPDEFWNLTPAEIADMAAGYQEKMDIQMQMLAWHAANIMNVHLKRKVTVRKLLGKDRVMSLEERKQKFEKLMKLMKERRGTKWQPLAKSK